MARASLADTPEKLLAQLQAIFPDFLFERDEFDLPEYNYHELLGEFTYYYGCNKSKFTERQVKSFAAIINLAIESGGDIENAFSTCFLEHLHQINAKVPLVSYLSSAAKKEVHA